MSILSGKFLNAASALVLTGALLAPQVSLAFNDTNLSVTKKPGHSFIGPAPHLTPQDHALKNPLRGEHNHTLQLDAGKALGLPEGRVFIDSKVEGRNPQSVLHPQRHIETATVGLSFPFEMPFK